MSDIYSTQDSFCPSLRQGFSGLQRLFSSLTTALVVGTFLSTACLERPPSVDASCDAGSLDCACSPDEGCDESYDCVEGICVARSASPSLDIDWTQELASFRKTGVSGYDYGDAIAIDERNGDVVVVGTVSGALSDNTKPEDLDNGLPDAFIARFNAEGDRLWLRQYGTINRDTAPALVLDESGNAYVVGTRDNWEADGPYDGHDGYFDVFDPSGELLSSQVIATGVNEWASDLVLDSQSNAVIVGSAGRTSIDPEDSTVGYDPLGYRAFAVKLAPNGAELWRYTLPSESSNGAEHVASDAEGNIYLAVQSTGPLEGSETSGTSTSTIVKLNSMGQELWRQGFSADAAGDVTIVGLKVLAGGQVVAAANGPILGSTSSHADLRLLSESGDELWRWRSKTTPSTQIKALTVGSKGGSVVVAVEVEGMTDHLVVDFTEEGVSESLPLSVLVGVEIDGIAASTAVAVCGHLNADVYLARFSRLSGY